MDGAWALVLTCWQTAITLLRTARLSEPSFNSRGARYVFSQVLSLSSVSARAILSSTLDIKFSSRASAFADVVSDAMVEFNEQTGERERFHTLVEERVQ